jgi:hypothetical protein
MLAGAAGLMWYSYWVDARGYGAAALKQEQPLEPNEINKEERDSEALLRSASLSRLD